MGHDVGALPPPRQAKRTRSGWQSVAGGLARVDNTGRLVESRCQAVVRRRAVAGATLMNPPVVGLGFVLIRKMRGWVLMNPQDVRVATLMNREAPESTLKKCMLCSPWPDDRTAAVSLVARTGGMTLRAWALKIGELKPVVAFRADPPLGALRDARRALDATARGHVVAQRTQAHCHKRS